MLRRILSWSAAISLGVFLGVASATLIVDHADALFTREIGGWRFDALTGTTPSGPYERAMIARREPMAAVQKDVLMFTRAEDETGRPLNESCVYELSGAQLPARWWSVTIYARDDRLPRNSDHAFSVDSTRIDADRNWSARVAALRGDAINWISSANARRGYVLALRLYQPRQSARAHPERLTLPQIRTLSCPEAAS